jgi:hypothetical protein
LGYIVVGVDHPGDAAFMEYPDGRTAVNTFGPLDSPEKAVAADNIRVVDVRFVLDTLSKNVTVAKQIPVCIANSMSTKLPSSDNR